MENHTSIARFQHLIDPIRDIASNWDVDVADELSNYLDELEHLQITFDNGSTNVNFAEAALVISGSTLIYSKKVEYLHQLVLKSLEFLASKRSANKGNENSDGTSNKMKGISISLAEDERMLFNDPSNLLIDDFLDVADNIDLKTEPKESGKKITSLLAHKNEETRTTEYSRNSVLLMHSLLQEDQGGSLKMATCRMDSSGILMLGNIPHLDTLLPNSQGNVSMAEPARYENEADKINEDNYFPCDNDDGCNNWLDAEPHGDNGDMGNAPQDNAMAGNDMTEPNDDSFIKTNIKTHAKTRNAAMKRSMKPYGERLDPHVEMTDSKSVRKAACFRVPKRLKGNSETISQDKVDFTTFIKKHISPPSSKWSVDDWLWSKGSNKAVPLPLSGILLPMFHQIDLQRKRQNRKMNNRQIIEEDAQDDYLYRDPVDDHEYEQRLAQNRRSLVPSSSNAQDAHVQDPLTHKDVEYNDVGYDNMIQNDDYHYDPNDDVQFHIDEENIQDNDLRAINEDDEEALLAKRVDKILNEELSSSLTSSYKMICDKMILDFKRGLEKYAKETNLSRRVADWTNRIEPILNEQEKMPPYDIHEYSDRILIQVDKIVHVSKGGKKVQDSVKFNDIVVNKKNHSPAEVCRVFLACLQLANMGNIFVVPPTKTLSDLSTQKLDKKEIIQSNNAGNFSDSFYVKLLDTNKKIDIENQFMGGSNEMV